MIRIWHRSRVSPPRKTWSARKSRKLGMVIGIALIDVIGAVSVAAIITDRGRRYCDRNLIRPQSCQASAPSQSLNSIQPFPGRNRRRPCRNSRSRPTMNGRASTSSRESRNNLRRPPRFGRSSEARSRGPLIRFHIHSHYYKGNRNHSRACASGSSRSAYSNHGASHSAYSGAYNDSTPARSVLVVL